MTLLQSRKTFLPFIQEVSDFTINSIPDFKSGLIFEQDLKEIRNFYRKIKMYNFDFKSDKSWNGHDLSDLYSILDTITRIDFFQDYRENFLSFDKSIMDKHYITGIGSRETPLKIQNKMSELMNLLYSQGWTLRSGGAKGSDEAFEKGVPFIDGKIDKRGAEIFIPWKNFTGEDKSFLKNKEKGYIEGEIPEKVILFIKKMIEKHYKIKKFETIFFKKELPNFLKMDIENWEQWKNKNNIQEEDTLLDFSNNLEKYSSIYHDIALNLKILDLVIKYHPKPVALSTGGIALMSRNGQQIFGENMDFKTNVVVCYTQNGEIKGGTGQALRLAQDYDVKIINLGSMKYFNMKIEDISDEINEKYIFLENKFII